MDLPNPDHIDKASPEQLLRMQTRYLYIIAEELYIQRKRMQRAHLNKLLYHGALFVLTALFVGYMTLSLQRAIRQLQAALPSIPTISVPNISLPSFN